MVQQLRFDVVVGVRVDYEYVGHVVGQQLARVTDVDGSLWKSSSARLIRILAAFAPQLGQRTLLVAGQDPQFHVRHC